MAGDAKKVFGRAMTGQSSEVEGLIRHERGCLKAHVRHPACGKLNGYYVHVEIHETLQHTQWTRVQAPILGRVHQALSYHFYLKSIWCHLSAAVSDY